MHQLQTEDVLGYHVHWSGLTDCVEQIVDSMGQGTRGWLACLNPHSYVVASRRSDFRAALNAADWLIPDGMGIVLASRFLGGRIRQRVTGPDVLHALHARLERSEFNRIFFLGSSDATLSRIRSRLAADWPGLKLVGTYSPPFRDAFSDADHQVMIDRINAVEPDVLWVGMTAPKQELWIHATLPRLAVRFAGAVGAAFDFYAGQVRRPSPGIQRMGFEWLVRLMGEPRRLWRRTFVSMPIFLRDVVRAKINRDHGKWPMSRG